MFVSGLILPFYNDDNWPLLTQALDSALKGDVTPMLRLADFGADREPNGSYSGEFDLRLLLPSTAWTTRW